MAIECQEKEPIECQIIVERFRGFTFCQFAQINGTDYDTTEVKVLPTMFQGQMIESDRVTAIMLTYTEFEEIPTEVFTNFGDITRLKINASKFKVIKKESFATAPHLKFVEFFDTNIEKITSRAFEEAEEIEEITIEDCDVKKIAPDAFAGLDNLKRLKITGSKFSNTNFLKNLPKSVKIIK